ncbi:hypothetical protein PV325_010752 [Microctonus aethiopoides]|nr:hypothetical protein PV325_010752 [Microctonus aethiopoides]
MNPHAITVVGLLFGAIVGAGVFLYQKFSHQNNYQHQYQSETNRKQNNNQKNRNLTCPYCGLKVATGDYRLDCGHICHKSCHYDKPVGQRYCRFCRSSNEVDNEVPNSVTVGNNRSTASTSSETVRRRNYESSSKNCCYCDTPMTDNNILKLDCGHSAHEECYETYSRMIKVDKDIRQIH